MHKKYYANTFHTLLNIKEMFYYTLLLLTLVNQYKSYGIQFRMRSVHAVSALTMQPVF